MENEFSNLTPRAERHLTHLVVSIRKKSWLPIAWSTGVLLDISAGGFKIELVDNKLPTPGKNYWINLPLSQIGIAHPKKLGIKCRCIWMDKVKHIMGGSFIEQDAEQLDILEIVIAKLLKNKDLKLDEQQPSIVSKVSS